GKNLSTHPKRNSMENASKHLTQEVTGSDAPYASRYTQRAYWKTSCREVTVSDTPYASRYTQRNLDTDMMGKALNPHAQINFWRPVPREEYISVCLIISEFKVIVRELHSTYICKK
ncbi:23753_t:CDS:2, partial [Gigaspora rosea]